MKRVRLLGLLLMVAIGMGIQSVWGQEPSPTSADLPDFESMSPRSFQWELNPPRGSARVFAAPSDIPAKGKMVSSQFGPQPLEKWSRAVVQAISESGWDIYTFRLDGTDVRRLTDNPASDVNPSLNPAGTEIVFTSYRDGNAEIYKMAADGSSPPQRLTNNVAPDNWASWSPDGTRIVFSSGRDRQYDIYVMNADGSNQYSVQHDPYAHDVMPVWDPYGSKLYFVRISISGSALQQIQLGSGVSDELIAPMQDMENLRIGQRDGQTHLFFDVDSDRDGATELAALCVSVCLGSPPILQLLDAGSPNVSLLAGAVEPINDLTRTGVGVLYTRLRYRYEGDTAYIDDLIVEWGEWTNDNRIVGSTPLVGVAIVSGWHTDDGIGPTLFPPAIPAFMPIGSNGFIEIPFSGTDPGGSGIQGIMAQTLSGGAWTNVWSQDWVSTDGKFPIYPYLGNEGVIQFRVRGKDYMGNEGPWGDPVTFRYYSGYLHTQTLDGHGYPVPNPKILPSTGVWHEDEWGNLDGVSTQRTWGGFLFSSEHAGYGPAKPRKIDSVGTEPPHLANPAPYFLPPKDSVFQNGNFGTDSLSDWLVVGDPNLIRLVRDDDEYGGNRLNIGSNSYGYVVSPPQVGVMRTITLTKLHRPLLGLSLSRATFYGDDYMSVQIQSGDFITDLVVMNQSISIPAVSQLVGHHVYGGDVYDVYFFDLSPWQAEVITLRLILHSGTDGLLGGSASIGSVSLGSWTTPVIQSVAISNTQGLRDILHLSANHPFPETLVLTGQNFLDGVEVLAGTRSLPISQRMGEERLEIQLPADLPIGRHHIWVINPDQTRAVLPSALGVGWPLYLPLLGR